MLLGFRVLFSIRQAALLVLLQPNRNQWLQPGAFGGLKSHVGVGSHGVKASSRLGLLGMWWEQEVPKRDLYVWPGTTVVLGCRSGVLFQYLEFSLLGL